MMKRTRQSRLSSIILWFYALLAGSSLVCFVIYLQQTNIPQPDINWIPYNIKIPTGKFVIYNSKCHIAELHPWEKEVMVLYKKKHYLPCTKKLLLTTIVKNDSFAFLTVNKEAEKQYADNGVSCCYRNITRDMNQTSPDRYIKYSNCRSFVDKVRITTEAILVNCYADVAKIHKIYTNTHATAIMTDKLKSRIRTFGELKPPSVLILGIDSISRSNFFRTLASTSNYLKQKKWINYKAYNKVGYNTFPNVMAMLTGRSLTSIKAFGKPSLLFIDTYDLIWKDYQRLGYVTAYAEDLAYMNTFTYTRKGFKQPPTDFYYRPYTIATETLKIIRDYSLIYCAGPESYGERILNIAEDFTVTFANQPNFGLFWMNSFSHDDVNSPARMDEKLTRFLHNLERNGVMNNTIIIFLSDHGARYGRIRHTSTGWLEERLPFLHFWIPENFRKSHKREYLNLQKNSERLTTPYDLYMTLQHILVLSGSRFKMRQSVSCRKCTSLFKEVASVRSCGDASIDFEYCACIFYEYFNPNHPLVGEVAKFVVRETRRNMLTKTNSASKCATLEVKRIRSSRIATNYHDSSKNLTFMHIQFETKPRAMLEAIVRLENNNFGTQAYIEGDVHRLDLYKYTGWCVEDEDVKKYCICRWQFSLILRHIREWLGIKGKRFI